MTETKWTPGPWVQCRYGECTCGIVWSIPGDFPVCTIGGGSRFKCHAQFPVAVAHTHMADAPDLIYASLPAEQAVANANLMAAAPELYDALKETLEIAARYESGDYIERANAAMRKARGK